MCGGSTESTTLVIALIKGLVDTFNVNGIFIIIVGDVPVLAILIVDVVVALSKGLVAAIMLP